MSVEEHHLPSLIEQFPVGSKIKITGIIEHEVVNIVQEHDPAHDRGQNPVGKEATVLADSSAQYSGVDNGTLRVRMDDGRTFHVDKNGQIVDRG